MILDFFRHGTVDIGIYTGILQVSDDNERLSRFNHQCDEILHQTSSGFFVSQEQILGDLREFLSQHSGDISIGKVCSAIDFLKRCDIEVDSMHLESAIQSHINREPKLDTYSIDFSELPDAVRDDIKNRYEARGLSEPISSLMRRLAGESSWDPDEIRLLRDHSENEWLEWISSYNPEQGTRKSGESYSNVFHLVGTFLKRFASLTDDNDQAILAKIRGALGLLRARSTVDRLRVEMLFNYMKNRC
ncbi:MAG TPA: hypothetical protein DDY43_10460 [Synechococcales bacterium UBA10510]|nr:hypothetical protein [Synechococcales bacterium UBA10510]